MKKYILLSLAIMATFLIGCNNPNKADDTSESSTVAEITTSDEDVAFIIE